MSSVVDIYSKTLSLISSFLNSRREKRRMGIITKQGKDEEASKIGRRKGKELFLS